MDPIADLMEVKIKVHCSGERVRPDTSEVERLVADPAKAKKLLGWNPKYVGKEGLSQGILKTIDWFRKPGNLKFYEDNSYII